MIQERFTVTKYENNPEYNLLEITDGWGQWTISSNSNNDVEIECSDFDGSKCLYLTQDELKQVIDFLQSKVIDKQSEGRVYPTFKDEWGNSDWRDTGEMGG